MITVAITNYNYGYFIKHTVESVLNQSYRNFEIIIYDDASTDNSVSLLKKMFGNRVIIVEGKENKGAGFARNSLINSANGEYILFLDSDDLLDSDALAKLMVVISKGYDVVFGLANSFSDNSICYKRHLYVNAMVEKLHKNECFYTLSQIIPPWNKLISTKFLRDNRIVFSEKRVMEDALFAYLLAFARPKVGFIFDTIIHIRHHSGSLSSFEDMNKLKTVVEVTCELLQESKQLSIYSRLRLDGNNLVYFLANNTNNPAVLENVKFFKKMLPFWDRVLIVAKLLKITHSIKYIKLI